MRKFVLIFLWLGSAAALQAESFAAFVARLERTPADRQSALADSFYASHPQLPFCESDSVVHFIYRGAAVSMLMAGDANNWNPGSSPLRKIGATTLWYRTEVYQSDARLDYKFVLNNSAWVLDPRNPWQCRGGFGANSELRMPGYQPPAEVIVDPAIAHGTVRDTLFYSAILNNKRTVRVYTPPGYAGSAESYPLVLFHDGPEYVTLGSAATVLDNLLAQKRIRPMVAVFVPPYSPETRSDEYAGSRQRLFGEFIVNELLPWLKGRYRLIDDPALRATVGASNGGNISLYLGYTWPQFFGLVGAQSSYIQPSLLSGFRDEPVKPLRIYLDMGLYDIPLLIPLARELAPVLRGKEYPFFYQEIPEGHSWGNWRGHLDDLLTFLFPDAGSKAGSRVDQPVQWQLGQNYPNPFNSTTILPFQLQEGGSVSLRIYDLSGRSVAELWNGTLPPGEYRIPFDARNLASGCYFYQLATAQVQKNRPMMLIR